jgi:hypothetical protein
MSRQLFRIIFFAFVVALCTAIPSSAFKTGRIPETGRKAAMFANVHKQIFDASLQQFGFAPENIWIIDDGAAMQDDPKSWRFWKAEHHMDDCEFSPSWNYFKKMREWAIKDSADAFKDTAKRDEALHQFGMAYHGLQDFYSHSNYIEHALWTDQPLSIPANFESFISNPPAWLKTGRPE